MAQTSTMLPLGTAAPAFTLTDAISGQSMSLDQLQSEVATVVMFLSNHCPFVKHVQDGLISLADDYGARGVSFIAINANDPEAYPEDAPDRMRQVAKEKGYPFPFLFDETQDIARAYHAACTPDFFVFDADLRCVYRGQLDESRPGNDVPVTGQDIRQALDALLAGQPVSPEQRPSVGCGIKWRPVATLRRRSATP